MGILEGNYTVIEDGEKKRPGINKGFLKNKFTQAAAVGFLTSAGLKLAFSTSVRAFDVTGCASAFTGGTFSAASEIRKDYKEARQDLAFMQALRFMAAHHKWKYGGKFVKGAAAGFVGAGIADLALDYNNGLGNTVKEWTQPVRNYISGMIGKTGIGLGFSEKWAAFKNSFSLNKLGAWLSEKWAAIKNAFPPKPVSWQKISPFESTQLRPPTLLPTENGGIVTTPSINEASVEAVRDQRTLAQPIEELTEVELTPKQQLAQLLDTSVSGSDMDKAVYNALQGKPSAMNQVVDGLYNGRGGFEKDRKLAATLIQEFTAQLEGKPFAELSKAQQDLMLKLAYMQFNPEHAKFGVEFDPLHSLEIVEKLGRSWPGAPELAPHIPIAEPEEIAKATEKISCTITQNAPEIRPQFDVHCLPNPESLKPGDSVNLAFNWNNGIHQDKTMVIGPKAATMPPRDYLKLAMFEILKNAEQPVASAPPVPQI